MLLAHAKANAYQLDIFYTHIEGEAISACIAPSKRACRGWS